jgi:hypothetical protein
MVHAYMSHHYEVFEKSKLQVGVTCLALGLGLTACPDEPTRPGDEEVGVTESDGSTGSDDPDDESGSSSTDESTDASTDEGPTTDDTTDDDTTDDATTDGGELCGNGVIDGDEQCDTGELGGETCQSQGFGGGGLTCAADCTLDTSQCTDCGNGVIDGEEECDGEDLGDNATCFDLNLGTAMEPLGCTAECTYDFGMCSGCGDAVITDPEECEPAGPLLDKDELGGATCMSVGFDNGELSCSAGCTFETTNCYSCGDAVQQGIEECDGADFADLTCADFLSPSMAPFDTGSLTCVDDCTIDTSNCSLCGDGVVSGGEVCEPGVLNGETCGSQGFDDGVLGCNADCSGYDTSSCTDCGDGFVEGNEQCEGNDLAGESCNSLGFAGGGTLACAGSCVFDTSGCTNDFCGDGLVNGGDQCDCGNQGANCTAGQLGNQNCVSQGFDGGTLQCNSPNNCQYNTSACYECGDGAINPGEQCDGANLGGQTCVSQGFNGGGTLSCNGSCGFNTAQCISVPNPYTACVNPAQAITGAGPGINNPSIINIPVNGTVTDVNMSINATHTWPGDVQFRLIHAGVTRFVIDRPGVPVSTYGCSTPNFAVQLDDEGAGGTVENVCAAVAPGIFSPPARTPNQLLNGFDNTQMNGNWNLVTDDLFPAADNGTLTQWCVTISWQ